jgi:hypothetical protein
MNVVNVAERCHQLVAGSWPERLADIEAEDDVLKPYEWTRYEDGVIVHTPPNRWSDMGEYFDGER